MVENERGGAAGVIISYFSWTGVEATLATGDRLINIEGILGSNFGDNFDGDTSFDPTLPRYVDGRGGDDVIFGVARDEILLGGDGDDKIYCGGYDNIGKDILYGGAGNDLIVLSAGAYADGGGGDDSLVGGFGSQTFIGGAGNDTLMGYEGADLMDGGAGDDTIWLGRNSSVVDAGAGDDRIETFVSWQTFKSSPTYKAAWLADKAASSDLVYAGDGGDRFRGSWGADRVYGEAGMDVLDGRDGNDTLDGGTGNDNLLGGNGGDILTGGAGNDYIEGQLGDDALNGGEGHDVLDCGNGADFASGGDGRDFITGGFGADTIDAGAANDFVDAGGHDDIIHLGAGDDFVAAIDGYGRGDDLIFGEAGDDRVHGGRGDDTIDAGGGSDVLNGGAGQDLLIGGEGADVFQFRLGNGRDRILDFSMEEGDRLALSGGINDAWNKASGLTIDDGDILMDFGGGHSLRLDGAFNEFDLGQISVSGILLLV